MLIAGEEKWDWAIKEEPFMCGHVNSRPNSIKEGETNTPEHVARGIGDWSLTIDESSFVGCRRPGHVASNGRMEDACEFLVGTITCKLHQVGPPWQLCKRLQPLPQSNLTVGS
ncbi:hypothetical protein OIU74_004462 [Salix koriyanagi]|uniref:Uncharacterized protein n=1 Tax=Salix koriyanagi TaxID=2511006 RepID=A0A9Q0V1V7_9ROSI|nr:hypothetical protein OIU74_004462 [Salix koriyanagi]